MRTAASSRQANNIDDIAAVRAQVAAAHLSAANRTWCGRRARWQTTVRANARDMRVSVSDFYHDLWKIPAGVPETPPSIGHFAIDRLSIAGLERGQASLPAPKASPIGRGARLTNVG
jgi:hypothetical protein